MRRRLEGANLRDYSSSAAIESNLCGRQWGNESLSHALDLVHRVIGLGNFSHIPLERDLRPLKTARYTITCVNDWKGQIYMNLNVY